MGISSESKPPLAGHLPRIQYSPEQQAVLLNLHADIDRLLQYLRLLKQRRLP